MTPYVAYCLRFLLHNLLMQKLVCYISECKTVSDYQDVIDYWKAVLMHFDNLRGSNAPSGKCILTTFQAPISAINSLIFSCIHHSCKISFEYNITHSASYFNWKWYISFWVITKISHINFTYITMSNILCDVLQNILFVISRDTV